MTFLMVLALLAEVALIGSGYPTFIIVGVLVVAAGVATAVVSKDPTT